MAPEESEVSALSGSNSGTDPASHSTNRSKARQTLGRTRPIVYSDGQIIYSMGTFQAEQDEDDSRGATRRGRCAWELAA